LKAWVRVCYFDGLLYRFDSGFAEKKLIENKSLATLEGVEPDEDEVAMCHSAHSHCYLDPNFKERTGLYADGARLCHGKQLIYVVDCSYLLESRKTGYCRNCCLAQCHQVEATGTS